MKLRSTCSLAIAIVVIGSLIRTSGLAGAPAIADCPVFPDDNIWNRPVDRLPLNADSARYVRSIGWDKPLHPDFGPEDMTGIPFNIVSGTEQEVTVRVGSDESDTGPVPMPARPLLEGGGDAHLLLIDPTACRLYELFAARRGGDRQWAADSAAHYDLRSNALRPDGWTSADAAGLPIFPGLVRYEEVAAGQIRHAIRFTAPKTRRSYVWPARHFASQSEDPALPPMGLRVRLRQDFDVSGFSVETQVILRALKRYGMMLADNGQPWFITGAPHPRWDARRMVEEMRRVKGSDFEAVDVSSLIRDSTSGAVIHN